MRNLINYGSILLFSAMLLTLTSCQEAEDKSQAEIPVRGLKTFTIKDVEQTTVRRYPSVLQPSSITTLSFEISGRLKEVSLDVGQRVEEGQILAGLDTRSLELQVESAEAAVSQAISTNRNAVEDLKRQTELLKKGVTTKSAKEKAETTAETTAAQLVQANRSLDTAKENLSKAELSAPFSGILNSVDVTSFANVTAGSPVATIYAASGFETSFSVSFDVVNRLTVGKQVMVTLADNPSIKLNGHVKELGARADTVSSFPIVVKLDDTDPTIKAGMAVEIAMEFDVERGQGYPLPLSVLPFTGEIDPPQSPNSPSETTVFLYDDATSTVKKHIVTIAGVKENSLLVIDGLEPGDKVAAAGVSFLREGQKVKLLEDSE